MAGGTGLDAEWSEVQAGTEPQRAMFRVQRIDLQPGPRPGCGQDRNPEEPCQAGGAAGVIAVLVCQRNSGDHPKIEAGAGCPPLDLAGAEPGVDQERHTLRLDGKAVPPGTGAE